MGTEQPSSAWPVCGHPLWGLARALWVPLELQGAQTRRVSSPAAVLCCSWHSDKTPRSLHGPQIFPAPAPCYPQNCARWTPTCAHPGRAAPAGPRGWLGVWLPHPGPFPAGGTVEAKPVKPKKLLRRLRGLPGCLFSSGSSSGNQPQERWAWSPLRQVPGFPSGLPGEGTGAVSRMGLLALALASVHTNARSPRLHGLGAWPQRGAYGGSMPCPRAGPPWSLGDWLGPAEAAPPQHPQGCGRQGCEGRWCLGHLHKFPCPPQVPEVPPGPRPRPVSQWAAGKLSGRALSLPCPAPNSSLEAQLLEMELSFLTVWGPRTSDFN